LDSALNSSGGQVVPEGAREPEDAHHDQLNAEQHRHDDQRAAGPDQDEEADQHRDDAERQYPAPVPSHAVQQVRGIAPGMCHHLRAFLGPRQPHQN
jgi:hypothetical protein